MSVWHQLDVQTNTIHKPQPAHQVSRPWHCKLVNQRNLDLGSIKYYEFKVLSAFQLSVVKPKPKQLFCQSQEHRQPNEPIRIRSKYMYIYEGSSAGKRGFISNWWRMWREFSKPITEQSKAKPKQTPITFDTQLKPAPQDRSNSIMMKCQ